MLLDKGNQNRYLLSSLITEESISSAQQLYQQNEGYLYFIH